MSSKWDEWFGSFDAKRTALLVVDMQNQWVHEQGGYYIPRARALIPNINRLAVALRAQGGTIVWIRSTMTRNGPGAWPQLFEHLSEDGVAEREQLMEGHLMHELCAGLDIRAGDLHVSKNRFSAFIQGSANIEHLLRNERGVDTVLVSGVATHICCESTARDAMMRDFRTVMIEDANDARVEADHRAGLHTFAQVFGAVMRTDDAIARLRRA